MIFAKTKVRFLAVMSVLCVMFNSCIGSCDTPEYEEWVDYGNPVDIYFEKGGGLQNITLTETPEISIIDINSNKKCQVEYFYAESNVDHQVPDSVFTNLEWLTVKQAYMDEEIIVSAAPLETDDHGRELSIVYSFQSGRAQTRVNQYPYWSPGWP